MAAEGQCVSRVDSISIWSQHPLWQYETAGESVSPTVGGSTLSETSARLYAESITCVEFLEKGGGWPRRDNVSQEWILARYGRNTPCGSMKPPERVSAR